MRDVVLTDRGRNHRTLLAGHPCECFCHLGAVALDPKPVRCGADIRKQTVRVLENVRGIVEGPLE